MVCDAGRQQISTPKLPALRNLAAVENATNGRKRIMDQISSQEPEQVVIALTEEELEKVGGGLSDDFVLS